MMRFQIFVSYSQICVFDATLLRPFNNWTPQHVAQGFAWRPGSACFKTLQESQTYNAELLTKEIEIPASAIRVIAVPFFAPSSGMIEVASISGGQQIELSPGPYELRFEALPGPEIRFVFSKGREPRFIVLRKDGEIAPAVPLLETAQPA